MTAAVTLDNVSCVFGAGTQAVHAVAGVDLAIEAGEFFTLLGPSGSGKTTCLRMIGGFTLPTSGRILIGGEDVSQRPPYARPVNTVFQDYALFPHMSIRDNVAYSLMVRKVPRAERERRADELLSLVQLPGVGDRRPAQLSGGQRQRVALARALINQPKVLLLDEPLGALDLKLREQMQSELKALQRRLSITFLFITHDQHEALSMSDRVGVFNAGRLEQVGTPREIYDRPATRFVAQFVGAANVLEGEASRRLAGHAAAMLRPERIRLGGADGARAAGTVAEAQFFGAFTRLRVDVGGGTHLQADLPAAPGLAWPEPGQHVHLHWDEPAVHPLGPSPAPASTAVAAAGVPAGAAMSMPAWGARALPLKIRRKPKELERRPATGARMVKASASGGDENVAMTCCRCSRSRSYRAWSAGDSSTCPGATRKRCSR